MIDSSRIGCAIYVPGIGIGGHESFVVDDKWFLDHVETANLFVPLALPDDWRTKWDGFAASLSGDTAPFAEAVAFSNCISYDHLVPTVVKPIPSGVAAPYESVGFPKAWVDQGGAYAEALIAAAEAAIDVRFADSLSFRYQPETPLTRFSSRFRGRAEPLAMYAMALRQPDLLTEYLCLYRICEWADGKNGVSFINENVDAIAEHDFGELWTSSSGLDRGGDLLLNVFDVYRERAVARLEVLRTSGAEDIGRHLYSYRNGLAHGKTDLLVQDFGASVDAVAVELPLLRLVCRLAIGG